MNNSIEFGEQREVSCNYQFSNLCGVIYSCANILFVNSRHEGDEKQILLSPVGNKVTMFDMTK